MSSPTPPRAGGTPAGSVSYRDTDTLIRRLEVENNLLDLRLDGWCVWPLFRATVQNVFLSLDVARPNALTPGQRFRFALRDLRGLARLSPARFLAKTYSTARCEERDGALVDVFFDDLLLSIGDYVKVEAVNNRHFSSGARRALVPSLFTSESVAVAAAAAALCGSPAAARGVAVALASRLHREPRLVALTDRRIAFTLSYFYWAKKLWRQLLLRVRPRFVLHADAGEAPLNAAARELGIEVIEFQHGLIDRYNSVYSWTPYALPFKSRMPLPTKIFMFGEHWCRELATNGFWGVDLRPVGSPRVDRHRAARVRRAAVVTPPTLVVTAQGLATTELFRFLRDTLELVPRAANLRVFVKLHPVYDADGSVFKRGFCNDRRVAIVRGDEAPTTFELLTHATLHASISSTCHYDALALGVPTVVLPLYTADIVASLYESGHGLLAASPERLASVLTGSPPAAPSPELMDSYFAPHALETMRRELGLAQDLDV